jgi:hypothetical protein
MKPRLKLLMFSSANVAPWEWKGQALRGASSKVKQADFCLEVVSHHLTILLHDRRGTPAPSSSSEGVEASTWETLTLEQTKGKGC